MPFVMNTAAEVGGVDEGTARHIELCYVGIGDATVVGSLEGPRCGEGARLDAPCHVGAPGRIHRDAKTAAAPKEGGVDKGSAAGIELRHEGVATVEGWFESS